MAFNLRNFVMKTLEKMRESEDEYQIRVYALKWYTKGVLTDENMATIEDWYEVEDVENVVDDEDTSEDTTEEVPTQLTD